MNIILFGPPGAGKGTQSDNVANKFNFYKISTGDLLRTEINNNTVLGNKIKSRIDKGLFVSDEIITNLIINVLSNKKYYNRLVFDGYPRNINQAKSLDILLRKYKQKISCVLNLNVDKELLIKRILGRIICSKCGLTFNKYFNPPQNDMHKCEASFLMTRTDDNEKTIKNRYDTYSSQTLPVLAYYKDQKILHEIDGTCEINAIYDQICSIITSLEA